MIVTRTLSVSTQGNTEIVDITLQVAREVAAARLASGMVTVFVAGSTAGVTTIEFEPGLVSDFREAWQRLAPQGIPYQHDRAWGDGNGYSHVRASLLGPSLVVPLVEGKLALGTWQRIVLVDFDIRPRQREVIVQIIGE
ncbi:MAG: YjbQ family protein [Chloroflexi bacterium]|nr:YjbQ family protein [Chloroflexota bacterium]